MSIIDEKVLAYATERKKLYDKSRALEENAKNRCRQKIIHAFTHRVDKDILGEKFITYDGTIGKSASICFPTPQITFLGDCFYCNRVVNDHRIPVAITEYWKKYGVRCTNVSIHREAYPYSVAHFELDQNKGDHR